MTPTAVPALHFVALPADLGATLIADGSDSAGHPVVARVDHEGGAPLRCCLRDSRSGESLVLAAVVPEGPSGPYRERGPVFVHAEPCGGPETGEPAFWGTRPQVLRAYDHAGHIVGGEVAEVGRQQTAAETLLADPAIAFVQARNVIFGCYMLTIRRAEPASFAA